jgi:hypothetical protein
VVVSGKIIFLFNSISRIGPECKENGGETAGSWGNVALESSRTPSQFLVGNAFFVSADRNRFFKKAQKRVVAVWKPPFA